MGLNPELLERREERKRQEKELTVLGLRAMEDKQTADALRQQNWLRRATGAGLIAFGSLMVVVAAGYVALNWGSFSERFGADGAFFETSRPRYETDVSLIELVKMLRRTEAEVLLEPDLIRVRLPSDQVFARPNAAAMRDAFDSTLMDVGAALATAKKTQVAVVAHGDAGATRAASRLVTDGQARAVARFLYEIGIDESRLTHIGRGADQPIAQGDAPGATERNRRLEMEIRFDG